MRSFLLRAAVYPGPALVDFARATEISLIQLRKSLGAAVQQRLQLMELGPEAVQERPHLMKTGARAVQERLQLKKLGHTADQVPAGLQILPGLCRSTLPPFHR